MIRSIRVIFCDQEHGTGDVTFPNLRELTTQEFLDNAPSVRTLRSEAKKAGWSHVAGHDYCDMCTEGEKENPT